MGFQRSGKECPHTSGECISDASDPLSPFSPPQLPFPLLMSFPQPWPLRLPLGFLLGCQASLYPTLANYLFVFSHCRQKKSAPNPGEVLQGGCGYKRILSCSSTKRGRTPKRQRKEGLKQLTLILKARSSGPSYIAKQVRYKSKSLGSRTP